MKESKEGVKEGRDRKEIKGREKRMKGKER